MQPEEYERRQRALEAQLQADLELVQAGHEAKLRALEALRHAAASETTTPVPSVGGDPRQVAAPKMSPARLASPPPAPAPARRPDNDALFSLQDVLPGLPAVFDRNDVIRALGYTPSRTTLGRAISRLLVEEKIRIAQYSDGGKRTKYEKV